MERTTLTFFEFLDTTLGIRARILLVVLAIPLVLSFLLPLWHIHMEAPQYPPPGLNLEIYSYKLVGGHEGHDIEEINNLNHYIGMRSITRDELRDLDWIPFALIGLVLLTLRVAAIGNVRALVDLAILIVFVTGVAFGRFIYMLYEFGHNLDPRAPMDVEPFMPVVFGGKKIANFWTDSYPSSGSFLLGAFAMGVWAILVCYLFIGWRHARDARRKQQA